MSTFNRIKKLLGGKPYLPPEQFDGLPEMQGDLRCLRCGREDYRYGNLETLDDMKARGVTPHRLKAGIKTCSHCENWVQQ